MKRKRRYTLYIIEIGIGILLEALAFSGITADPAALTGIGSGILVAGLVQLFRAVRLEQNPELKKRFETASKDERYAFISIESQRSRVCGIRDPRGNPVHDMSDPWLSAGGHDSRHVHLPAGSALYDYVPYSGEKVLGGRGIIICSTNPGKSSIMIPAVLCGFQHMIKEGYSCETAEESHYL